MSTLGLLGGVAALAMLRWSIALYLYEQRQELNFGQWEQPF